MIKISDPRQNIIIERVRRSMGEIWKNYDIDGKSFWEIEEELHLGHYRLIGPGVHSNTIRLEDNIIYLLN